MRRSKLEMHVDILKALVYHGPLKLTHIMYEVNISCSILKHHLDFLKQQNLIEEKSLGKKRIVYAITDRGRTVLGYFKELNNALPIIEEAQGIPALLY